MSFAAIKIWAIQSIWLGRIWVALHVGGGLAKLHVDSSLQNHRLLCFCNTPYESMLPRVVHLVFLRVLCHGDNKPEGVAARLQQCT